jgi:hypothetical protein
MTGKGESLDRNRQKGFGNRPRPRRHSFHARDSSRYLCSLQAEVI